MGISVIHFFFAIFLTSFLTRFSHLANSQMGRPFFFIVWYTMSARIFNRLSKIYYSPQGYCKGFAAIKKLAQAAKVLEDVARNWLMKQALWQVYLPAPRYIPTPKFDVPVPNKVHQADLLYLPHDRPPRSRKTFKYALTVVDVASRYKANRWPQKRPKKSQLLWNGFIVVVLWSGRNCFRSILVVSLWALWINCFRNIMSRLDAAVWIFTVIKLSLKDSTAPWLNDCLDTSMGLKCASQTTKDRLNGWPDCPLLFQLWIKKSLNWPVRNSLRPSKRKLFHPNPRPLIWDPLV